jgi:hypothetical protein
MKKFGDLAALFFIFVVVLLSLISILGVWDILGGDVITKSFETLGFLAFVAVIIMVIGKNGVDNSSMQPFVPNPIFKTLRQVTVVIAIASSSFLALLGILAIWEVISDTELLYRSFSSLGILAFASLIIIATTRNRDTQPVPPQL